MYPCLQSTCGHRGVFFSSTSSVYVRVYSVSEVRRRRGREDIADAGAPEAAASIRDPKPGSRVKERKKNSLPFFISWNRIRNYY